MGRELALELARRDLVAYAQRVPVPGSPLRDADESSRIPLIESAQASHHRLILSEMQRCMETPHGRLMIMAPPGSAKSTYATVVAPSWFLGKQADRRVILASYGGDLARRHGRRTRQLLRSGESEQILHATIADDSRAADEFSLTNGSEYIACGIMAGVTGNRAHGIVIDDPIKGREDADSQTIRNKTFAAYEDDLLTRLIPGGWVVIIQCMTGDTPVLMSDGTEKLLRDVRVGDSVASYRDGKLVPATVLNWANQGPDSVYEIRTSSGTIVKANERHPFLVERDGNREWVKVRNLKIGDGILRARSTGESGEASSARTTDVTPLQSARATACRTTTRPDGPAGTGRHQSTPSLGEKLTSSTGTGSTPGSTSDCCTRRVDCAPCADSRQERMCERTGEESCASTIATKLERCAGCSATTAISSSDTERRTKFCGEPLNTYEITPEEIVSIALCGREDVFDIQVSGTENFIANGLVSHNTRWHEDDIAGRILPSDWAGESGDIKCRDGNTWRVLCLQAECQTRTDPMGRQVGQMLWPEWFDARHWDQFRTNRRTWSSLYQQIPAPAEGILFRRDDMAGYEVAPSGLRIIGASDYAVTPDGGDWTEHGVAGIAEDGAVFLLDWWRGQVGPELWIERQIDLMARWSPLAWFGEAGPIRRATESTLRRRMTERHTPCRLEWLPSITDKATRAQSIIATAGMGRLFWPRAAWVPELQRQCLVFPAGQPDDGVDTLGLIGRGASTIGRALNQPPKIEPIPMRSAFARR